MHGSPRASGAATAKPRHVDRLPVLVEVVPLGLLRAMVEARRRKPPEPPRACQFELDLPIAPDAFRRLHPRGPA